MIETTCQPLTARARRLPPDKLKIARAQLQETMSQGVLRPSKSSWASPIHMAPKKGPQKWRVCGDYRALNAATKPDRYPEPNIMDFNTQLRGAKMFTTIDIKTAYNQIPMNERDIEKTAIITPFGLFEYTGMPYGLRNSAQTWQRYMDTLFRDFDFLYVFIDDILIAFRSAEEHEEHVRRVLVRLQEAGLVINCTKCRYAEQEVDFLSYRVTS